MEAARTRSEKPLVVLVHHPSLLRLWMERSLEKSFRLCVFSGAEEALAFIRSASSLNAIITDLDFGSVESKGIFIVRKVMRRFPNAAVFVFAMDDREDPRFLVLRNLKGVCFLSGFGALLIGRYVERALEASPNI